VHFVLNFVAMETRVGRGKIQLAAFNGPFPKTPPQMQKNSIGDWRHLMAHPRNPPPFRRENLAKISYASRVIANFVPNFVAMATGVGRGKM